MTETARESSGAGEFGEALLNVREYYESLRRTLCEQANVLSRVLPHDAEMGKNNEEAVRGFLHRILPRQFSLGSGFVVSSNANDVPSGQTDIVIYDEYWNSPLFREAAACVFPIESVYGAIEVRTTLQSGSDENKLGGAVQQLTRIRKLGRRKWYVDWHKSNVRGTPTFEPGLNVVDLCPRCFIFAFDASWTCPGSCIDALKDAINERKDDHPFIHGLVVLEKNWFIRQLVVGSGQSPQFEAVEGDAVVSFCRHLLDGLGSFPMSMAAMTRYLSPTQPVPTEGCKHHEYRGFVFTIEYLEGESCFRALFPDFPSVITAGVTISETFGRACDALDTYLGGLRRNGQEPPRPRFRLEIQTS